MKENIIKFLYPKKTEKILKEVFPIKTVQNTPEWYKKLEHTMKNRTIKGCIPVLDTLTAGYILKMPQDMYVKHNVTQGSKKDSFSRFAYAGGNSQHVEELALNINMGIPAVHDIKQLGGKDGGCPLVAKNKNIAFYKIINPFKIKTPPGYSCLFVPPLNNGDDRFEIISGIVDTDIFPTYINFPIILNGDKYPVLETTIERGTPYVQVIPFKRDAWKMEMTEDDSRRAELDMSIMGRFIHNYKTLFWSKKSWK
tara:strand:+ start:449 stop:1207 length:759 start_codon:yes stop_codon:yes gene_type:complete